MIMISSLAALALGAVPVPAPTPVQTRAGDDRVKVEAPTEVGSASPFNPAWKPKPKPWLAADAEKPVNRLPVPPKA